MWCIATDIICGKPWNYFPIYNAFTDEQPQLKKHSKAQSHTCNCNVLTCHNSTCNCDL